MLVSSFQDPETLERCTTIVLLINPGLTTLWNIRKSLVASGHLDEEREMDFTALVLTRKQKTAQAFAQRQFVWRRWQSRDEWKLPRLEKDLSLTAKAADSYPNNYHAWNHRSWVIDLVLEEFLLRSELDFSTSWIKTHVSDHSGVHYRGTLLRAAAKLLPAQYSTFIRKDLKLASELILDFPGHESLWYFRRFLVCQAKAANDAENLMEDEREFCAAVGAGDQKRFADKHIEWLEKFL